MTHASGDDSYHELPALSIRQPWAELILTGRKTIEVRSWSDIYRGRLWVHAGGNTDTAAMESFGMTELFTGGFVGLIWLLDIVPLDSDRWEQWRSLHCIAGPAPFGAFAWILEKPQRLRQPLPGRGRLKLFRVDPAVEAQLLEAIQGD